MVAVGETYIRAIIRGGGTPVVIPPITQPDDIEVLVKRLDGLLLSGGEDIAPRHYGQVGEPWMGQVDEDRDATELGLTRIWLRKAKPLLAICRGIQVLNVAIGGTLYQDISTSLPEALDHTYVPARSMEAPIHPVNIESGSMLAKIIGGTSFDVNSAHHQAVDVPGNGAKVVAHAPDGIIEAIEFPQQTFCIGVQWHPEAMIKVSDIMVPLFTSFVHACKTSQLME
jgi:putative glutamine amidotransferase